MGGVRPRGSEKGGSAESTKVVREGCMEEVGFERSAELEVGKKRKERVNREGSCAS